jgi:hypothetical protein
VKRREFLELTAAAGVGAVTIPLVSVRAADPSVLVTDQPMAAIAGFRFVQIGPGEFFTPECLTGVMSSRVIGMVSGANAVLLMEALRDLRASVSHAATPDGRAVIVARIQGADWRG